VKVPVQAGTVARRDGRAALLAANLPPHSRLHSEDHALQVQNLHTSSCTQSASKPHSQPRF
jgi:hypothetical protein